MTPLEQLWAGWRNAYVSEATDAERRGADDGCVFCAIAGSGAPSPDNGMVFRGDLTFAVLNAYPYASGHLLVLPLRHVSDLEELTGEETAELWATTLAAHRAVAVAYGPDGVNIGANLGRAAGAGIPRHLHLHVVPRWSGDTNFMTSVAGVRVIPETLAGAWKKLISAWPGGSGAAYAQDEQSFDSAYDGRPPWDIGRPQSAFVRLADSGAVTGRVLDVGCGTGEHALLAAGRGLDATGIDSSPKAVALAEAKAVARGLGARFVVWDALRLDELGERFDTVLDCGLFHVFDDRARGRYVEALAGVLVPGGRYFMLCFSDREPGDWGPRRVGEQELRDAFASGWVVEGIEPSTLDTNLGADGVEAWLVSATREDGGAGRI